ncbi:hypothetical protein WI460_12615 [Gemmatimonadota bacterium Y43]|uniref:hypothetical protein n=1 Tax=Gaopeijia maritima TaxID=3119007 RepID=UPI0032844DDF
MDHGTTARGYVRFAVPSTVSIAGGRVFVGEAAERESARASRVIRSPKTGLLQNLRMPWSGAAPNGALRDDVAAALVVGEALRGFRGALNEFGGAHRKLGFNIDLPVSEIGDDTVSARFKRVLQAGRFFARELSQECSEHDLMEAWVASADLAASSQGMLPEAQVVMKGIEALIPIALDRKYMIVDAGAGTLDTGIFKVYRYGEGRRIAFWASETIPHGCDLIDEGVARLVLGDGASTSAALAQECRVAKIEASRGRSVRTDSGHEIRMTHVDAAVEEFDRVVRPHYLEVLRSAYNKDRNLDRWQDVGVITVGGGALLPPLSRALRESPAARVPFAPVSRDGEPRCEVVGASRRPPDLDETPFLIPSIGLTFSAPELDELIRPVEVQDHEKVSRSTGVYDYDAEAMWGH